MAVTTPPWGRLRRESSPDRVASAIRDMIVAGALDPGVALRQRDVAREFGLSRIPVREAFVALEREGWITLGGDNGAYVRGISAGDVLDHYELRGIVLGLIARRVVERATDEDVAAFVDHAASMKQATDLAAFSSANDRFLGRLLRVAGSTRLRAALLVSPSILPSGFFDVVTDGRAIQQRGVAGFLTGLRKRSPDDAEQAFRSLLRRQGRAVQASVATRSTAVDDDVLRADRAQSEGDRGDGTPDLVVRHVKQLIFDGALTADQRLPQDDIATALGVSRIPIRQAIISLERDGWLRVEPHRGAFVVALDDARIADHFELLGRFYGFGARCMIERSATAVETLGVLADRLAERTTAQAFERANREYLHAFVDAAASPRLRIALGTSTALVPGSFFARVPQSIATQKDGVAAVQSALAAADATTAEAAFAAMERAQGDNVIAMRSPRRRR